jgi:endogenous inhibitor of DNA gyrase (YacG/DUF329 family)
MSKRQAKTRGCKSCGKRFALANVDDEFCSPPCRENDLHPPIGDEEYLAAYRVRNRSKETWAAYQKAEKKREKQWLKENVPLYQGKVFLGKDGSPLEGYALERYLVDKIW